LRQSICWLESLRFEPFPQQDFGIAQTRAHLHLISKRNKMGRLCWGVVWLLLYRPSPIVLHSWRSALLRLFGAEVGKGVHPYPSSRVWAPWNLTLRDGACLGSDVDCYNVARVELEERAIVSQRTYLCTATHDYTSESFALLAAPISIGRDAWIAAEAFVGPGVRIGEGAVIGARSVVLRPVDDWIVAAGNPATPLKARVRTRCK
jgi:putative colanic acid biosynthesis acetyltransferase WcaF